MTAGKQLLPLLELSEYSQAEGERRHQNKKPDMKREHIEITSLDTGEKALLFLRKYPGYQANVPSRHHKKKKSAKSLMLSIYHPFQANKFSVADPEGPVLLITTTISVWHKTM